jgi:hypothetical protein
MYCHPSEFSRVACRSHSEVSKNMAVVIFMVIRVNGGFVVMYRPRSAFKVRACRVGLALTECAGEHPKPKLRVTRQHSVSLLSCP